MKFLNVYYDAYKNYMYHKYIDDNGKRKIERFKPKYEFYIEDNSEQSELKDVYGTAVIKKELEDKDQYDSIRNSVKTWETDVSRELKFLNSVYLNEKMDPNIEDFNVAEIDIEVESPDGFEEAKDAGCPINLITLKFFGRDIWTWALKNDYTGDSDLVKNYKMFVEEEALLKDFILFFRKHNVDILTDWYGENFDLPYIINRCKKFGIDYTKLSPFGIVREGKHGDYRIAGVAHLDYQKLYKKFTKDSHESYSLNAISMDELKEGKLEFEGSINDLWATDWNKFVEYNIQDVLLLEKLEKKLRYIKIAIMIAYDSLIPLDAVFATIPMHTGYALKFLHRRNIIMPPRGEKEHGKYPGAYVYSKPGKYKYIMSYDVQSEYPTMIMQYNIGPETLVKDPKEIDGLLKTPTSVYKEWSAGDELYNVGGIYYKKDKKSVLSEIVKDIFTGRLRDKEKQNICKVIENDGRDYVFEVFNNKSKKELKIILDEIDEEDGNSEFYYIRQYVKKIQINSLYGAVANKHFHFYDLNNATAITLGGQDLIRFLGDTTNDYFKKHFWKNGKYFNEISDENKLKHDVLILTDTDSCYFQFEEVIEKLGLQFKNDDEFADWATKFDDEFLAPFFEKILKVYANKFGVEQLVKFKKEKIATDMIVLAKKRYAVRVKDNEGERYDELKLSFTGIEVVRTDTPIFCRNYIKDVIEKIFDWDDKNRVLDYMKKIKKKFETESLTKIASPTGISDYDKYGKPGYKYLQEGLSFPKGCIIHARAAICYNYINEKYKLKLQPITNGTKMKYVYIYDNNMLHTYVIGFVGNWPERFNEWFKINYEIQWIKTFQDTVQRFFDVIGWGIINFSSSKFSTFFK